MGGGKSGAKRMDFGRKTLRESILASPSLLSADWHAEVASSASPPTSTRRPVLSSAPSSRTLSATPLCTPNTPRERPSPLSTLSTLSRDRAEPSTVSADEQRTVPVYCAV